MRLNEILEKAVSSGASDIFLIAGVPVTFKINGIQNRIGEPSLTPEDIEAMVDKIYTIAKRSRKNIENNLDDDFSFSISHLGRFRVNVFRQRGSRSAVIRVIKFGIPDPKTLVTE